MLPQVFQTKGREKVGPQAATDGWDWTGKCLPIHLPPRCKKPLWFCQGQSGRLQSVWTNARLKGNFSISHCVGLLQEMKSVCMFIKV